MNLLETIVLHFPGDIDWVYYVKLNTKGGPHETFRLLGVLISTDNTLNTQQIPFMNSHSQQPIYLQ